MNWPQIGHVLSSPPVWAWGALVFAVLLFLLVVRQAVWLDRQLTSFSSFMDTSKIQQSLDEIKAPKPVVAYNTIILNRRCLPARLQSVNLEEIEVANIASTYVTEFEEQLFDVILLVDIHEFKVFKCRFGPTGIYGNEDLPLFLPPYQHAE